MSYYTGDYSKQILPYGSGSTRGMSQRHYEAIADVLRGMYEQYDMTEAQSTVRDVAEALAKRFAQGNDRFRHDTFINAATNKAREVSTSKRLPVYGPTVTVPDAPGQPADHYEH